MNGIRAHAAVIAPPFKIQDPDINVKKTRKNCGREAQGAAV
jgi:hypothetical protein